MLQCLYLTGIKPSRKSAQLLVSWLEENYPECSFTELNVNKPSAVARSRGGYQGRVEGPAAWSDGQHAADRQAVFDAARRLLAD